jgi:hypothetical protein
MTRNANARLKEIAVAIYLLIIPLVLYFKYFPTIVNSSITNALFLALLASLVALLVYGSFLIKKSLDVYLLLPQILILAFVLRAVPFLRLSDAVLEDSYPYLASTTEALNFGVSNAGLSWWYDTAQLIHWPLMQLLTVTTALLSGIDMGSFWRFQEPFLGILFVLAAFILAKLVLKNDGMALLSALIALSATSAIYYQSEYHPQGLGFTYFVFVAYVFLKFRETRNRLMFGSFLIFLAALVFCHPFSSLFIGLFAVSMILLSFALMHAPRVPPEFRELLKKLSEDYIIWLLIAVSILAYQVLGWIYFALGLLDVSLATGIHLQVLTAGATVPVLYTVLTAPQYILLLLSGVSIVLTVRTQNMTRVRCAVLAAAFLIVGFFGNYTGALPYNRTLGFYAAFGAVFVAITVYSIKDQWFPSINKSLKTGLVIALICALLVTGILGSQVPAYFFKDSGANNFYFSSNDLSSLNRENTTGTWIHQHVAQKARIGVEFDTLPAVFYYGMHKFPSRPYQYTYYSTTGLNASNINGLSYVVVNPSIPYSTNFNKTAYLDTINVVFDDGQINVGDVNGS